MICFLNFAQKYQPLRRYQKMVGFIWVWPLPNCKQHLASSNTWIWLAPHLHWVSWWYSCVCNHNALWCWLQEQAYNSIHRIGHLTYISRKMKLKCKTSIIFEHFLIKCTKMELLLYFRNWLFSLLTCGLNWSMACMWCFAICFWFLCGLCNTCSNFYDFFAVSFFNLIKS